MADNTQMNKGVGGDVLRSLATAGGVKWPTATVAYATTISDGNNILQVVTPEHGLPVSFAGPLEVEQADEAALNATVFQGGTWEVELASGSEVKLASGSIVSLSSPVTVFLDGSALYYNGVPVPTIRKPINVSGSGDNEVVAGVAGMKILVISWGFSAHGDTTATWRSNTTPISGPRPLTRYASAGQARNEFGNLETASGESLNLHLSDAVMVGGNLTYALVPDDA